MLSRGTVWIQSHLKSNQVFDHVTSAWSIFLSSVRKLKAEIDTKRDRKKEREAFHQCYQHVWELSCLSEFSLTVCVRACAINRVITTRHWCSFRSFFLFVFQGRSCINIHSLRSLFETSKGRTPCENIIIGIKFYSTNTDLTYFERCM